MMTGDQLIALLGKPADDPEVQEALREYQIRWAPEREEPDDDEAAEPSWYVFRPSSAMGFEFTFQDAAHLRAADPAERGEGPLILSQVCFYGKHEGVKPYGGELPFGLKVTDARDAVRTKLAARVPGPRSHRRDVWDPPPHRIVVAHDPSGYAMDSVLVKLRLTPWPPVTAPPPMPTLQDVVALFGQRWYAPVVRRWFSPMGLDDQGPDIATHRYADLRQEWGCELLFFRDRTRDVDSPLKNKGAEFSGIKLYGPRHEDARAWSGQLPFGLSFDDPYPVFAKKVGRPQDEGRDENLDGWALWHFPDYTLHIFYDNIDNVIGCVSIFAPGAWC